ncbi:MAG: orotidine-5'-phosphate decarboxylase [Erysipelotrichaceae bacterium]|nr:orotidine-5'-phosphate decarboxylase [Erysipelotrichaceae bacterium]
MMQRDVIIACDFSSKEETLNFLDSFKEEKPYVKIGMELYYACGPEIVKEIKSRGHKIFLDLKLHDIPNTVYKAMKNVAKLGVDMTNVHASGTIEMMKAAKKAIDDIGAETKLIAVTQLTSTSEDVMHEELLIPNGMQETVAHYALNAKKAGLDGVVCSPLEATIVKETCGEEFVSVTPGIRFADDAKGDQKRVTTPAIAKDLGCHYIVVGRSITGAKDPVAAYRKAKTEFQGE